MRSPRSLGAVLLLALALVLVAVLAYQAQDAARSHRRMAESTLHDYAAFADGRLSEQAKNSLMMTIMSSFAYAASRVNPGRLEETLLPPEEVEVAARDMAGSWCQCLGGVKYFFRYDWKDGTFRATATDLPDAALAWARDTIVSYAKSLPTETGRRPRLLGSADGRYGPLRQLGVLLTNDSYAMLLGDDKHVEGDTASTPPLLVFAVARDPADGKPIVIYCYATDPRTFLEPTFARIRSENALLPPSLLRDTPTDSILSISVTTLRGHEVYRSPGYFSKRYSVADTVEHNLGR